jgi:hypothetical protein
MLDTELVPAADQTSRRLMVVLQGLGDSMDGYRWLPQALNLPWLNYRLVNAPDDYYGGFSGTTSACRSGVVRTAGCCSNSRPAAQGVSRRSRPFFRLLAGLPDGD